MNFRDYFNIPSDICYLNSAGNGLLPARSLQWRQDWQEKFFDAREDHRDKQGEFLNTVRAKIATYFQAANSKVYLCPNFSFAYASLLDRLPTDREFLILEGEYPSIQYPLIARKRKITSLAVHPEIEASIYEALRKNPRQVFVVSIVQYITGLKLDIAFFQQLKRDFPETLIIADGSQYLGTEPFDFDASGLDAMASSGYKWLCSGFGNGFLLLNKNLQQLLEANLEGIPRPTVDFWREKEVLDTFFEPGHIDTIAQGTLLSTLSLFQEFNETAIAEHIQALSNSLYPQLEERELLLPLISQRKNKSSLINIQVDPNLYPELLQAGLKCIPRGSGIRIGLHLYNNESDIQTLIRIIDKIR